MAEVIGEIQVDFDIIQSTDKTLWVADNSVWSYSQDKTAYILITLPGSTKQLTYTFKKEAINVFNSNNLGITCPTQDCTGTDIYKEIPDGIYTIEVKSGFTGFEKTRYYLKTDRLELELAKLIVKNGFEYSPRDKDFRDRVYDIKWLIDTAKSHAKLGDFTKANRFFQEARENLKSFQDCKDCN